MSESVNGCSCSTRERDSNGETTEKNGFSVVAAISTMVRSSTAPSSESCWVRENRCTSSMNSTVCSPVDRSLAVASAMTALTSLTPAETAESWAKCRPVEPATRVARVVLPVPGGPYSNIDDGAPPWTNRRSGAPGPSRCA